MQKRSDTKKLDEELVIISSSLANRFRELVEESSEEDLDDELFDGLDEKILVDLRKYVNHLKNN